VVEALPPPAVEALLQLTRLLSETDRKMLIGNTCAVRERNGSPDP